MTARGQYWSHIENLELFRLPWWLRYAVALVIGAGGVFLWYVALRNVQPEWVSLGALAVALLIPAIFMWELVAGAILVGVVAHFSDGRPLWRPMLIAALAGVLFIGFLALRYLEAVERLKRLELEVIALRLALHAHESRATH